MLSKHHFVGKLTLSNRIDKMDYRIVIKTDHDILSYSISDILNNIYKSNSPFISITIRTLDDSIKLIHTGQLNTGLDKWGVLDYCVIGKDDQNFTLGLELFNLTGRNIDITIKHLEEKEIKKKALEATN